MQISEILKIHVLLYKAIREYEFFPFSQNLNALNYIYMYMYVYVLYGTTREWE